MMYNNYIVTTPEPPKYSPSWIAVYHSLVMHYTRSSELVQLIYVDYLSLCLDWSHAIKYDDFIYTHRTLSSTWKIYCEYNIIINSVYFMLKCLTHGFLNSTGFVKPRPVHSHMHF